MKTTSLYTALLVLFILSSCSTSQKIAALKPEADDATPLIYENATSFIKIPIQIKLKDIENQTNKFFNGLLYEDITIEDDDIEMKVWKQAPISIENFNGKIKTVLPLKAFVKYRIGTDKLGIALYTTREFNLNAVVTLLSTVNLSNWKLNTVTELKSFDWKETPSMNFQGKMVPITYLINPAVRLFRSKIEKKIDEAIAKSLDFKPNVLQALEKICSPLLMNEDYESWLRVVPIELYTTNAQFKKDLISMEMGMKCTIETLIGQKPVTKFDKNKIILKPITQLPDHIKANIIAVSTYQDASKIITKNFSGKEFVSGNKKITVQNVALWHKNGKMVIALDLLGSLNGTIYLTGSPQYNETTKEIYFDQLNYALDTKSKLVKTANWLAQGYVLRKIQESCRYSIQPNLEEGKMNLLKYLKNYSPLPGVFVNGTIEAIRFEKIQLTNQAIIAFITINGDVNVNVDGIK